MAIKPSITSSPIASTTQTPKKKGSGFVSFNKAAEQNLQASQQLGQQIGSNIGQQVQAAQGQVGAAAGGVKSQLQLEKERLGQAQNLVQGLKTDPVQVAKSQYADLTSGTAKQADTKDLASLQGTLGSTAQVAQQFSSNPFARQQAIQSTVRRPTAMQNLTGVQRNLDSMLLGRNVNTQDLATQTARQAFNVDRLIGSTLKEAGKTGKELQEQALQARSQLKEARQSGISDIEKAGESQAIGKNIDLATYRDYLSTQFITDLLNQQPTKKVEFERAVKDLQAAGFDPYTADIADFGGIEGAKGRLLSSLGTDLFDSTSALTDAQRARLKALRNLEDETYSSELDKQFRDVSGYSTEALKDLAAKAASSASKTKELAQQADFKTAAGSLISNLQGLATNWDNAPYSAIQDASNIITYLTGKRPTSTVEIDNMMKNPEFFANLQNQLSSGDLERQAAYNYQIWQNSGQQSPWLNQGGTPEQLLGQERASLIKKYFDRLSQAQLIDPSKIKKT